VHHIYIGAVALVNTRVNGGVIVNVPGMPGFTDLVDGVSQGVLTLGLERNVKVNCGARRWAAQALPVLRDGIPGVLDVHVIPR